MAAPRFLAWLSGRIKMVATIATSAGAADAEKIPSTNGSGVLDPSILNAATTGVSKVVLTDGTGKIDVTILPTGVGPDTASITSSENLAAGDLVNVWDDAGTVKVRKADATAEGKEAMGFVLAGVTAPAAATVYFEGQLTGLTGLTRGARQYLSTTPGGRVETAPSGAGNVAQEVGHAISTTVMVFEPQMPVTVA